MRLLFRASLTLLFFFFLGACKKNEVSTFNTPIEIYENKGLKVTYPKKWKFVGDGSSIRANRLTSFDLPGGSTVSIGFYKNKPVKIEELVDNYVNKLAKSRIEEVTTPQVEQISPTGFPGTVASWTTKFMGESKVQGVVIQLQKDPFPVIVDAYLYDEDIDEYWKHIEPFLKSITFDPNKIELDKPSLF